MRYLKCNLCEYGKPENPIVRRFVQPFSKVFFLRREERPARNRVRQSVWFRDFVRRSVDLICAFIRCNNNNKKECLRKKKRFLKKKIRKNVPKIQ